MIDPHQVSMIISLIVATTLGFVVGVEREFVGKEAGIKTYALVALGAALFTVISFDPNFPDPSRIISQIVVGIGFIGAGSLFSSKQGARTHDSRGAVDDGGWGLQPVCDIIRLRLQVRASYFLFFLRFGSLKLKKGFINLSA